MPEPEKLERVPPEMEMSASVKSVEASERVKLRAAVSPAMRGEPSDVRIADFSEMRDAPTDARAMVGLTVSIENVSELSESEPSVFVLPAKSEKAAEATEITPSLVLLAVGVNVAV